AHEALGLPECEVCHGNHLIRKPTDEMLGVGTDVLCVRCHEPGSKGFVTAQQMREAIEGLKTEVAGAEGIVTHAAKLGMDTADAEFALHEAASQLTQARTYVHSFSFPMMEPIAAEGIRHTRQAEEQGRQAVHEFHFRRQGLWTTLVILALVIIGIVLMIREMEQTRSKRNP
ncbi:MAG: hypothetical protein HYT88_07470, partial [Candidatus Omnitrophica bacterium]|nr:hypothetical protein [Candidatus Omnitrophota bacterium]